MKKNKSRLFVAQQVKGREFCMELTETEFRNGWQHFDLEIYTLSWFFFSKTLHRSEIMGTWQNALEIADDTFQRQIAFELRSLPLP